MSETSGHEFTPENTRYGLNGKGRYARFCRACVRLRWHERVARSLGEKA